MTIGPIQAFVVGFPSNDLFEGRIADELARLSEIGQIRIVDAVFVMREGDDIAAVSVSALDDDQRAELRAAVGALVGLGVAGADGAVAGAEAGADLRCGGRLRVGGRSQQRSSTSSRLGARRSCSRSSTCGPCRSAMPCETPVASCSATGCSPRRA